MRDLETHRDPGPLFGVDLLRQHAIEEIEIGRLAARGVIEDRIQAVRYVAESQSGQLLDNTRMHDGAHCSPPATMAAYSAKSRPKRASAGAGADSVSMAGRRQRPS
jgi:hypothetical protein